MTKVVIFGGTTEGRELTEFCGRNQIPTLVCVATALGEEIAPDYASVEVNVGRMDATAIEFFLGELQPKLVIDATHPYAADVTSNVQSATNALGIRTIRISRSTTPADGVLRFPDLATLIDWLNTTSGIIFSTTGAKEARELTRVNNFEERIFLRLLPVAGNIAVCAELGYPTGHLIGMQAPFSQELNAAMFRTTGAKILVTKDSGAIGGLAEKLAAARECGMITALVDRPNDVPGVTFEEACRAIEELG